MHSVAVTTKQIIAPQSAISALSGHYTLDPHLMMSWSRVICFPALDEKTPHLKGAMPCENKNVDT